MFPKATAPIQFIVRRNDANLWDGFLGRNRDMDIAMIDAGYCIDAPRAIPQGSCVRSSREFFAERATFRD